MTASVQSSVAHAPAPTQSSSPTPEPRLSVVMVNWNGEEYLDECLDSIFTHTEGITVEVVLVDNASRDGSVDLVRERYPQVVVLENERNLGFARANNMAFQHCRGEYILLMNPDTRVLGDALTEMVTFMTNHPDVGIAGCKVLNPDLSLQAACRRTVPTPGVAFYRLVGLARVFPGNRRFSRYNLTYLEDDEELEVGAVSGSFLMIRREVLDDVGPLDEQFFLYGEELDWCLRVQQAGWKIMYNPQAEIIHYKGGSSRRNRFRSFYEFHRAMVLFHRKHFAGALVMPLNWLVFVGVFLRGIVTGVGPTFRRLAAMGLDGAIINLTQIAAFYIKLGGRIQPHFDAYVRAAPLMTLVALMLFWASRLYSAERDRDGVQIVYETIRSLAIAVVIIVFATFIHRGFSSLIFPYPRFVFVMGWIMAAVIISILKVRMFSAARLKHAANRIAIIGTSEPAARLGEEFDVRLGADSRFLGFIADEDPAPFSGRILGTLDRLPKVLHRFALTEVVIAAGAWPPHRLMNVIAICERMGAKVKILPNLYEILIGKVELTNLAGMPLIRLPADPLSGWYRAVKRGSDILSALLGFLLFSWMTPLIALGIRLSGRGPILYRQVRLGRHRRPFTLLKFRTMNPDAEIQSGPVMATPDDPRITPFGRFLRLTHLDELPQLLNIVRGEMSFVGPRPERPQFVEQFTKEDATYERRFVVRPGLTGLAQVNGRYDSVPADKLKFDLAYINNINPGLDLRIIMASVRVSMRHLLSR